MIRRPQTVFSVASSRCVSGRRPQPRRHWLPGCCAALLAFGLYVPMAAGQAKTVTITGVSACEGAAGDTTQFVFTAYIDPVAEGGESFDWEAIDGTATAADNDYTAASGTVNFAADDTQATFSVDVNGDDTAEVPEIFYIEITNPVDVTVTIEAPGIPAIIINDDFAQDVDFTFPNAETVSFVSTAAVAAPDPTEEIFTFGKETVYKGQLQPAGGAPGGNTVEAEPDEDTVIMQLYVYRPNTSAAPLPVFKVGGACGNIQSPEDLERITLENVTTVILDAGDGHDIVDGRVFDEDAEVAVQFYGGAGDDILLGGAGDDYFDGGAGNDYINGGAGDDQAPEGFDEEFITGGDGDDILIGGAGDDVMSGGDGNNLLRGGLGDDRLFSEGTYDTLDYSTSPDAVVVNLPEGTATDGHGTEDDIRAGFACVRGSAKNDRLFGYRDSATTLLGGAGNDVMCGGLGADTLYGEAGEDNLYGDPPDPKDGDAIGALGEIPPLADPEGGGGDFLFGGAGPDNLYGGPGADELYGDGDTVPTRGTANDDQHFALAAHPLSVADPQYADFLLIDSGLTGGVLNIPNVLNGTPVQGRVAPDAQDDFELPSREMVGAANDTLMGGGGADLNVGGGGGDTIFGGTDDYVRDTTDDNFNDGWRSQFVDGGDTIYGDFFYNRTAALAGSQWVAYPPLTADLQDANFGNDTIRGGFGNDDIFGCGGDDRINGNRGIDTIYGDFYFARGDDATYTLIATTLVPFVGSASGDDSIRGGENSDSIFGGPGDDLLVGGDDLNPEQPEPGEASVFFYSTDVFQGNSGDDIIIGCDSFFSGHRDGDLSDDNHPLDRGFATAIPGIDSEPRDTLDYSMVPVGGSVYVQLGDNWSGGILSLIGTPVSGSAQDGEGGIDEIYGLENVVGSRGNDTIIGSRRNDPNGRIWNNSVVDAFRIPVFPSYPTHPSGGYLRTTTHSGYDNILLGEDGDDLIIGRDGGDGLCGGNGNDTIWGDGSNSSPAAPPPTNAVNPDDPARAGEDEIWGDFGDDRLFGEWGDDTVHGGAGNDFMSGGNGNDTLAYTEADELDTVNGRGVTINLRQSNTDLTEWNTLATTYVGLNWPFNPAVAVIPAGGYPVGSVTVPDFVNPSLGTTTTINFPGGNTLPGTPYSPSSTVYGYGTAFANNAYDVIVNRDAPQHPDRFENILGSSFGDALFGHDTAPCIIQGGIGNDLLVGGDADDTIYGQTGNDILEGRGGDDDLTGGTAPPTPPGPQLDTDRDWAVYIHAPDAVVVNLAETGVQDTAGQVSQSSGADGNDRLIQIRNVLGSRYSDIITGDRLPNTLLGSDGDDLLQGRGDEDVRQNNRVYVENDVIFGDGGQDIADYRLGNPVEVDAAINALTFAPCGAPFVGSCGSMSSDGEGGADLLVNVENIRKSDDDLIITGPTRKVIKPDEQVELTFRVSGGDGDYLAEFDPTTTDQPKLNDDEEQIGTETIAILSETPFTPDVDKPDYQAVRVLKGTPTNGFWEVKVYARPLETTTFRITVRDMVRSFTDNDAPGYKEISAAVEVVVADELEVTIEQDEYIITAGDAAQLRANIEGGTPPYTIQWTADDASQLGALSATNILIPTASPTATTTYTITVTDTTPDSLNQVGTASTKVTVLPAADASGQPVPSTGGTGGSGGAGGGDSSFGGDSGVGDSGAGDSTGDDSATDKGDADLGSPQEVSGTEATNTPVAPMCGAGMTSWMVVGNLLALAFMRRRRH